MHALSASDLGNHLPGGCGLPGAGLMVLALVDVVTLQLLFIAS